MLRSEIDFLFSRDFNEIKRQFLKGFSFVIFKAERCCTFKVTTLGQSCTFCAKFLQCFFFPVKTKSARESHFCPFFRFSSRVENLFHGHFFRFLPVFFTGTEIGFTGRIYQKSYHFHGKNCSNFSRAPIFISRVEFDENPHGHDFAFTGTFLAKTSFFSREVFFSREKKPLNQVVVMAFLKNLLQSGFFFP